MKLRVLFFGAFAERRQERECELQVRKAMSLTDLLVHLDFDVGTPVVLAVNCQVVNDYKMTLADGDEVAVMPIFSGG